jgi:NAD(P)-dependent dehydrogenase (short-subunit alcohol dehydrogenase family)
VEGNALSEVVVITGASAGVGRALAREYGKHKAKVGLLARDSGRLEAAKNEIVEAGGEAIAISCDVADPEKVDEAAARVERELGAIDIWHNNAMTTVFAAISNTEPAEFKRATEVTYLGCVYGTMAALKRMLPRDRGVIVQTGSALAYRSIPLQGAYCGAKHAMVGFTDSLRCELIHNKSNVRVTMVHLPAMNTPQFSWCRTRLPRHPQPVPPIFEPEVAAEALYWAAHHNRRELFVGGPTVEAIYGQNFAPGFADWYLGTHGYEAQQTSEPVAPDRPDNLFQPVAGNYAARGIFTEKSKNFSLQTWADMHRLPLGLAAAGIAGLSAYLWKKNAA